MFFHKYKKKTFRLKRLAFLQLACIQIVLEQLCVQGSSALLFLGGMSQHALLK